MSISANFDNVDYINITGYKISCCFLAKEGIKNAFYVYIEQVIAPQNKFTPLNMGTPISREGTKRGTLIINGDNNDIDYKFDDIDLVDYQIHFSHFRKVRLLTFRYDPDITNAGRFCTISNRQQTKKVEEFNNKFAQDYTYSIQGQGMSESLFSISSKFSRTGDEIIRFGTQRTRDNSFMKLVLDMDEEREANGIVPKTIIYKGLNITINKDNFDALIVDETYGSFLRYGLPALDVVVDFAGRYPELLTINYNPLTPYQYLQHIEAPPTKAGILDPSFAPSIETAVLVLKPGVYLDHSNSMV